MARFNERTRQASERASETASLPGIPSSIYCLLCKEERFFNDLLVCLNSMKSVTNGMVVLKAVRLIVSSRTTLFRPLYASIVFPSNIDFCRTLLLVVNR